MRSPATGDNRTAFTLEKQLEKLFPLGANKLTSVPKYQRPLTLNPFLPPSSCAYESQSCCMLGILAANEVSPATLGEAEVNTNKVGNAQNGSLRLVVCYISCLTVVIL